MNGLVIAAPMTGSGKTLVTLGLARALTRQGLRVQPAKAGPDYIDSRFLTRAAGRDALTLDAWAMAPDRLRMLAQGDDLLLVEGVMGLFDGARDGTGSAADLAEALGLPVVLVVNAESQGASLAPLVHGFLRWRPGLQFGGVILNRVSTTRQEALLRQALSATGVPVLGALPKRDALKVPSRHLGLVLPDELDHETLIDAAADQVAAYIDLAAVLSLVKPAQAAQSAALRLPPLGQRIAIARDDAFAFLYAHWLSDWRAAGAEIHFFSPLADEPPRDADAIFLPGGYPELHAGRLALAMQFKLGLIAAAARGALIYGECGGFMVLGETLTDASGTPHAMVGLLPHSTSIARPRRTLGYRRLRHASPLPFPAQLSGHEFHYSSSGPAGGTPLFAATDALGEPMAPMGLVEGRIMGSYAHVIDRATTPP
jgi:cobyrinic acid a,c-diamide synthase